MISSIPVWVLLIAATEPAGATVEDPSIAVEQICVDDLRIKVPAKAIAEAANLVDELYRDAGIAIQWTHGTSGEPSSVSCRNGSIHVHMLLFPMRPARTRSRALASTTKTRETDPFTEIFYDAVERYAYSRNVAIPMMLGYVMAHEIGHVLLGQHHTRTGIMRNGWGTEDLLRMNSRQLRFHAGQRLALQASARRFMVASQAAMHTNRK